MKNFCPLTDFVPAGMGCRGAILQECFRERSQKVDLCVGEVLKEKVPAGRIFLLLRDCFSCKM